MGALVWGVALSVTGLPVLAKILAKLKLLYTDIGKTAMSAALANEISSWVGLTVMISLGNNARKAPWALMSTIGFIVFCVFVITPSIIWTIRRTLKEGYYSEETICVILTSVLACGLATDLFGTNSMIGAFVFGLMIPNGLLGPRFLEVLKGFVEDVLMPVFFTASGFRTNFGTLTSYSSWFLVAAVIAVACLSKVVSTLVVAFFHGMPLREGVALGVLMNTKGILALIAINTGRDRALLEDKAFTVIFIAILVMTMATQPIMSLLYKPKKSFLPNKHRAIQRLKQDAELRILACVHEAHSVAGIVNLLEASNPSRRSPIIVFSLHLIQLTGHTTALLIVHGPNQTTSQSDQGQVNHQILKAFEQFEEEHGGVLVHPLTAMSPYTTMHEDICNIAEDKRVTLIILPYHKRQTIHNNMEELNHAYKDVNDNVLVNSPCSVGILVDRGFGKSAAVAEDSGAESIERHISMLFIGGADDREALCYARRMAGHPNVTLTVVRFVESKTEVDLRLSDLIEDETGKVSMEAMDAQVEIRLDESFISEFRHRTAGDKSIMYFEKAVRNGAETIETIKSMCQGFDLFIVGRGMGMSSPLTAGIDEWSEGSELGAIGNLLVASEFSSTVSILVVQQFAGARAAGEGLTNPWPSESHFEPFAKHRDMGNVY
ncbi:Cation/H(+) antiporter like [Actinidia chinensis var. chinensis]|uniref:Cation/H(+) antiporter like n=1 Tax=Actinidia chinensis var. chinensis TaxID=1590841 RepID=A0A2R6Q6Q5_ACTCC|nr:Cation/H(+) antiporter like [Actinidia chinensis var. chinensis]